MNLVSRLTAIGAALLLSSNASAIDRSLKLIGQPLVEQAGGRGAGSTVVVLESKADASLPLFGSCTAPGQPSTCRVTKAFRIEGGAYIGDVTSHGTNVAGIVASVAPMASLILIDPTNSGGLLPTDNIVSAVDWAVAHRAVYNIVAINLSYGLKTDSGCGTDNETKVRAVFARARAAGISVVLSAGNQRLPASDSFPQCAAAGGNGIVVGALYDQTIDYDNHSNCPEYRDQSVRFGKIHAIENKVACDSNFGPAIDIFAPGAMISIPDAPGNMWGTSQAAPHVTGAIAVLRGAGVAPGASPDQVLALLKGAGYYVKDEPTPSRPDVGVLATPILNLTMSYDKALRDTLFQYATEAKDPAAEKYYVRLAHELLYSYYGRPAEPRMAQILVSAMRLHAMPSDLGRLHESYRDGRNYQLNFMIDSFGDREESLRAYPGNHAAFVNGVYRRLIARDATSAEIAHWADKLDRAELSRGAAILSIIQTIKRTSGTDQAADMVMFDKMVEVSTGFTAAIDMPIEVESYVGDPAMDKTRAFMSTVTPATAPGRFIWNIQNFINTLVADHAAEVANNPPAPPPPPRR